MALVGCAKLEPVGLVNQTNYRQFLQDLREEVHLDRSVLTPLRRFLIVNDEAAYRAKTAQATLDRAHIELRLGYFYAAMKFYRMYSTASEDIALPHYLLAMMADHGNRMTGRHLFHIAARGESHTGRYFLTEEQTRRLIGLSGLYYFTVVPPSRVRDGVKDGDFFTYAAYEEIRNELARRILEEAFVHGRTGSWFNDAQIEAMMRAGITDHRLVLAFRFLQENRRFADASALMQEHGVSRVFHLNYPLPHTRKVFLDQALRILYHAGEYGAALDIAAEEADLQTLLNHDVTRASGYVWLGASAIELGDLEEGIDHALAAVRESIISLDEEEALEHPDLFATIYQIVFNDTFGELLDSEEFQVVAEAIERKLDDYRLQGVLAAVYGV